MAVLVNSAGASAADPILKGLGFEWVFAASTNDVADVVDAWIDQAAGFPGTNSVLGDLHPAETAIASGTNGGYTQATNTFTTTGAHGLAVGDWIYVSGGGVTAGFYQVLTAPTGTTITTTTPMKGSDGTGISYQVAWAFNGVAGTGPSASSVGGQINYFKARVRDNELNQSDLAESHYVRDAPTGTNYISLDGKLYNDDTVRTGDTSPSLVVLPNWSNKGGISTVRLANHSGEGSNSFRWADTSTGLKSLTYAETGGNLVIQGADGPKYGRLEFASRNNAGAVFVGVDIAIYLDTTAPTLVFAMYGR